MLFSGDCTSEKCLSPPFVITKREQEVLVLTANGCNPANIADQLTISSATVAQHLRNIRSKLRAKNTTHAVATAIKSQLIDI